MTTQLELALRDRDTGMSQVTSASSPDAVALVDAAIREAAASGLPFTCNSIRSRFPDVRSGLPGARVNLAARRGLIRATGRFVPSTLRSTRGHRIAEWVGVAS